MFNRHAKKSAIPAPTAIQRPPSSPSLFSAVTHDVTPGHINYTVPAQALKTIEVETPAPVELQKSTPQQVNSGMDAGLTSPRKAEPIALVKMPLLPSGSNAFNMSFPAIPPFQAIDDAENALLASEISDHRPWVRMTIGEKAHFESPLYKA